MLVDSNILIYAASGGYQHLRDFIEENSPYASEISRVEVLGYHLLSDQNKKFFVSLFKLTTLLPLSSDILDIAIRLRQQQKMAIGDALIAATAIAHELPLVTRNTKDFKWIAELKLIDPFVEQD